jgi:hypothetical protein
MNSVDALSQWNGVVKSGGRLNVARALQNPTVCTFTLDRASQNVTTAGGTFSVSVTAPPNCDYSVVSNNAWIKIDSNREVSGTGTMTFTALPSASSTNTQTGSITIAGQTFTVNQTTVKSRKRVRFF